MTESVDPTPVPDVPRDRTAAIAITLAAVFLLATAAFVTFWLGERGDHKSTVDQLGSVRVELQEATDNLVKVEKRHGEAEASIKLSEQERKEHEASIAADRPCAEAAREWVLATDDAVIRAARQLIEIRCR